jgi:molecular chaperone GrpE
MSEQENTVTENSAKEETEGSKVNDSNVESSEETSKIANLEEEINKLKVENSSLKDSWLRERAEFQNYKRRTANEYLTIKREAVKSFVIKIINPFFAKLTLISKEDVPDTLS